MLEVGLDSKRVCCVDQDACVLRSDDRFNDRGDVVDVRQGLDTEKDVVK